jgi:hypothetical protein
MLTRRRFSLQWFYGARTRDDYIEIKRELDNKVEEKNEKNETEMTATAAAAVTTSGGNTNTNDANANANANTISIQLKRWSTFKCHHFPDGAIVTGFRGRRDYKDGVCQGIMCCKWCKENNDFITWTYTLSNGYNSAFSVTDFETLELCSQEEFTLRKPDAIEKLKQHFK